MEVMNQHLPPIFAQFTDDNEPNAMHDREGDRIIPQKTC